MTAPCYKCDSRRPLCHATCERYAAFARDNDEAKTRKRKEDVIDSFRVEGAAKYLRREKKKPTKIRGEK